MKVVEGSLVATGKRFAIVASRWNEFFRGVAHRGRAPGAGAPRGRRGRDHAVSVSGQLRAADGGGRVAQRGGVDAIVCLGVLIRGATPHFDYICSAATSGIAGVGLEHGVPVSYGVLTCDTLDQAIERSGSKAGNKGEEAALAALEMANLYTQIDGQS